MNIKEAIDHFSSAYLSGRLAHGYIVVGAPRGDAGAFVLKAVQTLYCTAEAKPCGSCKGCKQVEAHTLPDVLFVEPEKKSRLISVDQVRDLQKLVYQTSYAGSWKVCVISHADRMGDGAANAFLKTLEEPPERCIFFLVTDAPQGMLATILSRCQRLVVSGGRSVIMPELEEALVAVLADNSGTSAVAAFSRADRVDAILKVMKGQAKELEEKIIEDEGSEIDDETLDARVNARYREFRLGVMQYMLRWYRDILLLVCDVDDSDVTQPERIDVLRQKAKGVSYAKALRNIRTIEEMNAKLEGNLTEASVLSLGFCTLT